jgi:hypothetical protein
MIIISGLMPSSGIPNFKKYVKPVTTVVGYG